ncbi:YybH family protein [Actinoplanes sp. CA-142083]|uniref:YybH family protein n=1 Tax=Actinoplanes sp. CA-142083 TaxID=3239903 RepID=UPI003D922BF8
MTDVLQAARNLVEAFAAHNTEAYFGSFAADATFIFHTHETPLRSRSDYEQIWYGWEQSGFHVRSCESSDQNVQHFGDIAVFTHRVRTVVFLDGAEQTLNERETIVFHREADGRWLAVHEHLSPDPS